MAPDATTTTERSASPAATDAPVLRDFVGGEWVESRATDHVDVFNPATGAVIARTPLGTRADVDAAVAAAKAAFPGLARDPGRRAGARDVRVQEPARGALRRDRPDLTTEHGKTLDESRGSVRRGIENVELACGMPSMMMGYGLEDIARGLDCDVHRQPMGVFGAIAPVQLPRDGAALVPPVRRRDRQHLRRQAVRARPALAEAHLRAAPRAASRPAS